jgi:hypothetical protein
MGKKLSNPVHLSLVDERGNICDPDCENYSSYRPQDWLNTCSSVGSKLASSGGPKGGRSEGAILLHQRLVYVRKHLFLLGQRLGPLSHHQTD